jgi:hypothetical protein
MKSKIGKMIKSKSRRKIRMHCVVGEPHSRFGLVAIRRLCTEGMAGTVASWRTRQVIAMGGGMALQGKGGERGLRQFAV